MTPPTPPYHHYPVDEISWDNLLQATQDFGSQKHLQPRRFKHLDSEQIFNFFFLVHIQFIELFYLSIIIYPDMLCVFFVFRGDILYMNMI